MRRAHLNIEALQSRDVPATFGVPWANPTAVTVSFAPDGADVDGSPNQLGALMAHSGLSPSVWQGQILKAIQAWAAQANLNVGVVGDDGSPIGTSGYEQADSRFGDIRIFAIPLSSSNLAITTPPGDLGGTRTGDIILNSNYNFGVGSSAEYDLYTVLLQESGHAFGVANSPNTSSAMYEFYQGVRSGLSSDDIAEIRRLYGNRPARTWEPSAGNDTRSAATTLPAGTATTFGDIASASDSDWYSFNAPADGTAAIRFRASGLSLLAARVVVTTPGGTTLATAKAASPGQDLVINLTRLRAGSTYYVRVDEVPGTVFAAGQYQLTVDPGDGSPSVMSLAGQPPVDDDATNENFLTATTLYNTDPNGGTSYQSFAHLRPNDTDVYRVRSPMPGFNQANVLTATVRAFGDFAPTINVLNSLGLPVQAEVTANGNGLYTVKVLNAAQFVDYYMVIRSQTGAAGDYDFAATFRSRTSTYHEVASGLLTLLDSTKTGTLRVTGSAQIYFRLTSALTPIIGPSVMVRIYDSNNKICFQLLARAGDDVSGVALLSTGDYRVVISANGALLPNILSAFTLSTALLTDPTGVNPSDPNDPGSGGPPPEPSGYKYYDDRGFYVWGEQTPTGDG